MKITIWHNPNCSNSRNALALIRNAGHEPRIIEYLKAPPLRAELASMIVRMGLTARELIRTKEAVYRALNLDGTDLSEDELIDAMAKHPTLINRPIVETDKGIALCRPPERVIALL